jgi:hypothetical protein
VIATHALAVILSPSLSVILTLNPSLSVILKPFLHVILSGAKNLAMLRTGSVKGKNLPALKVNFTQQFPVSYQIADLVLSLNEDTRSRGRQKTLKGKNEVATFL